MQPPYGKNDFPPECLENSLQNLGIFFPCFAVLPYCIKDCRVYLIDIGSHTFRLNFSGSGILS